MLRQIFPAWLLAVWFGLTCVTSVARGSIGRRYHARARAAQSLPHWGRAITGGIVVTGLLWGMSGTAILLSPGPNISFFIIMMAGAMMSAGVSSNAAYRPAIIGLAMAIEGPVIAALLIRHDPLHGAIAALLIIYTAIILNAALKFNRVIADNIQMRFAQEEKLVDHEQLFAQVHSSEAAMAEAQRLGKTGSWVHDLKTNIFAMSPEAYRITGVNPANLSPDFDLILARIHPDDQAMVRERAGRSRGGSESPGIEFRMIMDDGEIKYLHSTPRTILDDSGQAVRVIGAVQDITARRLTEDCLQLANLLLKTQMEASPDGIQVANAEREMIAFNQQFAEIWRVPAAEMKSGNDAFLRAHMQAQVKSPEDYARRIQFLAEHAGEVGEDEILLADGRILERYSRSLCGAGGGNLGRVWYFRDITARHIAAQKLQFANILLNTQMEASRDGILVLDHKGKIIALNQRYGDMSRARFDDLLGQDFSVSVNRVRGLAKDQDAFLSRVTATAADPMTASEVEFESTDGRFFSRYMTPLCAANGEYLGRAWFYSDITERRNAADALAYRDLLLHTVTAATAVAVSAPTLAAGVNAALAQIGKTMAVERILLWRKDEDDLKPLSIAFAWVPAMADGGFQCAGSMVQLMDEAALGAWRRPADEREPVIAHRAAAAPPIRAAMETHGIESLFLMPVHVGGALWGCLGIDACAAPRDWAGSEIETVGILAEIIGSLIVREQARLALVASEERFRLLTGTARDAIALTDEAAIIRHWNGGAEAMFGYAAEEVLGRDIAALLGLGAKEADVMGLLRSVTESAGITMDLDLRRKDGSKIAAGVSVSAARFGGRLEYIAIMRDITERKMSAQKLQFANTLLTTQMEASPNGILVVDAKRNMISCNARFAEIWRLPAGSVTNGDDAARREHITTQVATPAAYSERIEYLAAHPEEIGEDEVVTRDGRILERYSRSLISPAGEYLGRVWFFGDVTARKAAEQKLLLTNTLLKTQMEAAPDGIYAVDAGGRILSFNRRFAEMFAIALATLEKGQACAIRDHTAAMVKNPESYLARIAYLNGHPGETGNDALELQDGRIIERHSVSIQAPGQENLGRVWFCRDVTARRAADALTIRLARQDALTGLVNRVVFVEAVNRAIGHARREGAGFAVLFLDLDHFKDVNDTLGHPAGDTLLKTVAARLSAASRETDTVGRFGGDEFAVILAGVQQAADAGTFAEKLIEAINVPIAIDLNTVHVGASIGIELFSPTAADSETLLAHADVALYRAKAEGRGTFRFFTAAMDRDVRSRVRLGAELREALRADEFVLLYQPQVEARTGAITGVEALIRWRHPTRGLLAPDIFFEAAETTGAITQLGHFVLWTACRQAAAWAAAGHALPRLSFNVSAMQFKTAAALEADILAALAETGLPPSMLELELTEFALMNIAQENSSVLRRLKERGVKLAIDDFGTGFSSLEHLRRFPADHIKIARDFTRNVETEAGDASIVRAIIGLANELNITPIAEGIETRGQLDLITSWGCTQVQGFYYSRPVPAASIASLLAAGGILLANPNP
jgi:diguanylate cyclase (GGDEF)-like protein/PAS domain S-box-containing protein